MTDQIMIQGIENIDEGIPVKLLLILPYSCVKKTKYLIKCFHFGNQNNVRETSLPHPLALDSSPLRPYLNGSLLILFSV